MVKYRVIWEVKEERDTGTFTGTAEYPCWYEDEAKIKFEEVISRPNVTGAVIYEVREMVIERFERK